MSKLLQWVIGIGVVVMVIAVIFASVAPLVLPRLGLAMAPATTSRVMPRMPFYPGFMFGLGRPGFRPPFFGLFGLLSCLWPLLLVGLFVWVLVSLTRRQTPLASVPPMAAQSPLPPAPASLAVCSECGQPLQPGWRHCPSCGKAVES
jgi:hypothetical protein